MSHKNSYISILVIFTLLGNFASIGGNNLWLSHITQVFGPLNNLITAPSSLTQTVTLADLGYVKDETLQGILVTRSYSINWPNAWQAKPGN